MNQKYFESAILFSRLYGIAETLNPWTNIDNETFIRTIKEWTDEFVNTGDNDILTFFESKIEQKKTGHIDYIE